VDEALGERSDMLPMGVETRMRTPPPAEGPDEYPGSVATAFDEPFPERPHPGHAGLCLLVVAFEGHPENSPVGTALRDDAGRDEKPLSVVQKQHCNAIFDPVQSNGHGCLFSSSPRQTPPPRIDWAMLVRWSPILSQ